MSTIFNAIHLASMRAILSLVIFLSTQSGFGMSMRCIDLAVAFNRPVIKTKRLQIRPLTLDMIDPLMKIQSHPLVRENFGFTHQNQDAVVDSMHRELVDGTHLNEHLEEHLVRFRYGIYFNESLIGIVTLRRDVKLHPDGTPGAIDFSIGRAIHPDYWGQGLAPEIAVAIIDHLFATTTARSVHAYVYEWNSQSFKTWERFGFEPIKLDKETMRLYVMRRADWASKRSKFLESR